MLTFDFVSRRQYEVKALTKDYGDNCAATWEAACLAGSGSVYSEAGYHVVGSLYRKYSGFYWPSKYRIIRARATYDLTDLDPELSIWNAVITGKGVWITVPTGEVLEIYDGSDLTGEGTDYGLIRTLEPVLGYCIVGQVGLDFDYYYEIEFNSAGRAWLHNHAGQVVSIAFRTYGDGLDHPSPGCLNLYESTREFYLSDDHDEHKLIINRDVPAPLLTIEYEEASEAIAPKLTIEHDPGIPPVAPMLTVEHEYIPPVAPELTIEHSAPIVPIAPMLTIEHSASLNPEAPKLTIEYIKPTIPDEITPGIQIYINEEWQDISQFVMSLHTKRGRMHELDRVEAGTAVMILNNEANQFWRYNTESDYYPEIKPLVRIRMIMTLGEAEYYLFNGVIEAWKPSWMGNVTGGIPIMTIECVDLFKRFSRAYIREARPAELPGARINAVLTHIGWPAGADYRTIDAGSITIAALELDEANPENALQHMLDVALAEGGILFIDGAGKVVFQDSASRVTGEYSVTRATLTKDDFLPVQLSDDDTMIYNSAQINSQVYQVADIDPLIGPREYKETLPIASETDALARAYMIAERYKDSILRLPVIPIVPANSPERLFPMVYGYELSTRIQIQLDAPEYLAKIDQTYHIEGIQHKWDARSKLWRTDWQVWEVSQFRRGIAPNISYAWMKRWIYDSIPGYVGVWPHPGNMDPYNNDGYLKVGQWSDLEDVRISRGLIEIDTSGINAEVAEAHVMLCIAVTSQGTLHRNIRIVLVDPGTLAYPLQAADYGNLRDKNTILGESVEFDTVYDGQWIDIPLNATGRYHINKGGITKFGVRSNHDINHDGDDLLAGTILFEYCHFCGYGTGKEPYLVARLTV